MTQLSTIISAENTVSLATTSPPAEPASMTDTISPTSSTVTATARMIEPRGSPTRSARISAWCTEAKTDAASATEARMMIGTELSETSPTYFSSTSTKAAAGANQVQSGTFE
ncbi:MAG: hypothetical protein ABS57_17920 [Mesorhizobium sp. SCN 65-12]|nr:MAG: hypothetical protein ABS57_17920 [Mesorhizobium sp. SCN 65-12]